MVKTVTLRRNRAKSFVALLLTFAAGCVDIIGYLTLYHTFTAHMTGVTVHLGHWLIEHNWSSAALAGEIILAFVLGSIVGRIVIEIGSRKRIRSIASATLFLEILLLAAFIFIAGHDVQAHSPSAPFAGILLSMLAAAMGVQTATLTRIGALTIHTTFVTGMLNKLAQLLGHGVVSTYDLLHTKLSDEQLLHRNRRREAFRNASFIFAIWFFYLLGAVVGTALKSRWQLLSLCLPIGLLLVAISVDLLHPLSIEEERDQSES